MAKYITIAFLVFLGHAAKAQTTHQITVAINQGIDCPITGLSDSEVFDVYPNPATSSFLVQSVIKEAEVKLIDLNGREVRSKKMMNGELEMQVSDLPKGIYILHFVSKKGSDHIKIKIQ